MKAILFEEPGDPDVMYMGDTLKPVLQENQVLVKVMATALNRADTMQRMGNYPPPAGASPILGLEMSGIVEEVSTGIDKFKVGDRVCALLDGGGYAQYVTVREEMLMKVPDTMSFKEAAAIPEVFLTAYQALVYHMDIQSDETILIHAGASGVGTAAIQIARERGLYIFTTASKSKHEICSSLGAHHIIDYKSESYKTVIYDSEKKAVDAVLDMIAGANFSDNLDVMKLDGRMVMLAALGGLHAVDTNVAQIVWKRLKLMGSTLRSRSLQYKIKLTTDFVTDYWQLFQEGTFKPMIHSVIHWSDVVGAHEMMERNENAGKIVMLVD